MSKLEDKSIELLSKFEELATQYTPDVIDAALTIVQINGAYNITLGLIFILTSIGLIFLAKSLYKKCNDHEVIYSLGFVSASVIGFILAITGTCNLISIWNYIAIIDPKLALAYNVFKGVF